MLSVKRLKRIYYIPGIISLLIVPFMFIRFAEKELYVQSPGSISVIIASEQMFAKFPDIFGGGKYPPKRNYTELILTGVEAIDRIKLDFAQVRIREIISENDSTNGLRFRFGDSSLYWTFVKSLDILRIEGARTYLPLDDDIWFYHFPPEEPIEVWACGTRYFPAVAEKPSPGWWEKTSAEVISSWISSWQIIVSYVVFVLSVIVIRLSRNGESR